ncbi:uncharacterized protein LOC122663579 [Telopea speciosissima]|uniref:uncharacterized protein LOC122663579 n=1 Tax=Telopea speciosissima TaxID=54955 RepID=UPI001CC4BC6B|nr:uncharacterized protein LOC122663579 [Telopea speciosissima]XP_043715099.1 uncharacterized protein LOC122663579 [Telopea speciosissima]
MMSSKQASEDRGASRSASLRHTPLQIIHFMGNFMRIWSVYSMHHYLSQQGASVVGFIFSCLVPSSILFLALQRPWKGRPLSNTQVVPSIINGGIMALYFILWGKGLKSCGPLRAIMAEYAGAVLGVLSALLYGRRGFIWKKVGGLIAMVGAFYLLSQGWALNTYSPISFKDRVDVEIETEKLIGMKQLAIPITAGILSALRRVIARRVSLKNQLKRRLHAITITSATCFLFPFTMWDVVLGSPSESNTELPFLTWAYLSTILFGIILIFYIDNIAEERLHMVFSSPRHLAVAAGCIIIMEIVYKMDFCLQGFLVCSTILGFGIYEATSLDRFRKDSFQRTDLSDGNFDDQIQMIPLPT